MFLTSASSKKLAIEYNGMQVGNRFNVAYLLLGEWFYLKFE